MFSSFSCWAWCQLWVCHIWSLLCCDVFHLCPYSGEYLSCMCCIIIVFFLIFIYWNDHMDLSFSLLMWVSHWIICGYWGKKTCISGINPIWLWCTSLLIYIGIDLFIFCEEFCIYIYQSHWHVIFFFLLGSFVWFWYQGGGSLTEWVWKFPFLCKIWNSFRNIAINFSLNVKFTCKIIWSCSFVC